MKIYVVCGWNINHNEKSLFQCVVNYSILQYWNPITPQKILRKKMLIYAVYISSTLQHKFNGISVPRKKIFLNKVKVSLLFSSVEHKPKERDESFSQEK